MKKLFEPSSVVVVGASPTNQWGRQSVENFASVGFTGQVGTVNPRYDEILGYPCAPNLKGLPFVPDAILVSVNRNLVVPVIEEAAELGVKGAVVLAIGFAEAGDVGLERQRRLAEIAREADMAIVGPNCQGIIDFTARSALYMGHVSPYEPGTVALISQSGSVTTALANNNRGVRWSHIVSAGNEAVVDSADLLAYFVDHPGVRTICAFQETIRDPERYFEQCDRALAAGKPVIVLKSGRTEAARVAATAHSGALSAPDRLVDALFRRHGVIRVDSLEEMLETAIALQSPKRPKRGQLVSVTASGGQIELILDEVARTRLIHEPFTESTKETLTGLLPDFLPPTNPLDYWGMDDLPARYPQLIQAVADDDNVDIVIAVGDFTYHPTGDENRAMSQRDTAVALSDKTDATLVVLDTVDGSIPADEVEEALSKGVLLLSGLTEGMRAIEHLVGYSQPRSEPARRRELPTAQLNAMLSELTAGTSGTPALDVLAASGIRVPRTVTASTADEAVAAAVSMGFPVVLKSADPLLLHKTEASGVLVGVANEDAVRDGTSALLAQAGGGVLVQEQVHGGVEMLVGIQTDPDLGSFLIVGLGGIWTEVMDDVVIRAVGLRAGEAASMLTELRGYPLLTGARGSKPVDLVALVDVIEQLDALALQFGGRLEEVDVNPLIVTDRAVVAVDCLIVPRAVEQ